tara:strand:+ start:48 stop:179 length:132 start_codon:yes stop_codon:yes gene_type:complete
VEEENAKKRKLKKEINAEKKEPEDVENRVEDDANYNIIFQLRI